jgi:protein O-GlcNAc transferase
MQLAAKTYALGLIKWPLNVELLNNAGKNMNEMGLYDKAAVYLSKALKENWKFHPAHNNFGNALWKMEQKDGAKYHYEYSIKLHKSPEAFLNLGNIYKREGNITKAIEFYKFAENHGINSPVLFNNMGGLYKDIGNFTLSNSCYEKAMNLAPTDMTIVSNYLFSRALFLDKKLDYYQEATKQCLKFPSSIQDKLRIQTELNPTIKIGFISGDFWSHPVSYFLQSFLKFLDKNQIELHAFPTVIHEDYVTKLLRNDFKSWTCIAGVSDELAANHIAHANLDILIDLSGHSAENRLKIMTYRPCRIQATWLGFPMTTGLSCIDYFMGDQIISPISDQDYFSERIINFKSIFCCFNAPTPIDDPIPHYPFLSNTYITFGSFNKLGKITQQTIELWSAVLSVVPDSKLYLNSFNFSDDEIKKLFISKFSQAGINEDRLILDVYPAGRRDLVLPGYKNIDVVLDATPYPGGTTSVEAIWMGRPVVTLIGDTAISRIGATINHAIGNSDFNASDKTEFVEIAKSIQSNFSAYIKNSTQFRSNLLNTSLFNGENFAHEFMNIIARMAKKNI